MVEVFKTNVNKLADADMLIIELQKMLPYAKINFDLDDCDKILRIETTEEKIQTLIITVLRKKKFTCTVLD